MIARENRRILLVDEMPTIHGDFRKILGRSRIEAALDHDEAVLFGTPGRARALQFELASAYQGAEAVRMVQASVRADLPYAMAFIDVRMPPGCDGVDAVERLWKEDPALQVVLCTAYSDYSWQDVVTRLDAHDRLLILKKPFDAIEVYQLANALTTKWNVTRQAAFKMSLLEQAVEERTRALSSANLKIALLARTDGLTGLSNRATFSERLHQAFAAAQRGALPFAVLCLDLDNFKPVNDTLGHPIGDLLLQQVTVRLKQCIRATDLPARLGGDEFAILQSEMSEPSNAGELAAKIQAALALPYWLNGHEVNISVSIGICPFVAGIADAAAMLAQANQALYRSKEEGRNQYHFHSEALDQEVRDRVLVGRDLRVAIDREELELEYQPQVELSSQDIVGMEALVRWNHPSRGPLSPRFFIPIAEKTGTIVALGHWVLDRACTQMRLWRDQGLTLPLMAVNLSLVQLKQGRELVADITRTIAKWGLTPADLEFDVTEATLAQLTWTHNDVLYQLRELGVRIAIDDFGSEYSSFDYVMAHHVNHLKIAHSFVKKSTEDPDSAAMIRAIINFAKDIGVGVVAEGVETEQQCALLTAADSTARAQGFLFSKPVPAAAAAELLRSGCDTRQASPGLIGRTP